jgi:hypothetical protein
MCRKFTEIEMGLFGGNAETIVVSQAAGGQATSSVNVPVPIWEIVLIATLVSVIIFFACNCVIKKTNNMFDNAVKKQARIVQIENQC